MEKKLANNRINVLDGFRAIAILMVLFFHYFSRWTSLYPYGNKYDFFTFGKMGVHFFFIISGFVIFYTLENTKSFLDFWKNRMIRLFPSMLIASLITYFFCKLFDLEFLFPTSHVFNNVLASITFLPPDTLASLFNNIVQLDYISGSYWSLWPEIQFYLFVSAIYFFNKNNFLLIFLSLSIVLFLCNFLIHFGSFENYFIKVVRKFFIVFNFVESLSFFCFGVLFYAVFKDVTQKQETPIYLNSILLDCYFF
jgi:peptidoglycan/LPS O-acetylase OafA/YrhL